MLKNSLLVLTLSAASFSNTASTPATPLPEATAIKLDGAFTEAIWEQVPAITDFRQRDPKDGAAPTFKTDVRVVYDATNLYIAVRAHDPEPDRLVGMRTRRDTDSPSDWLKVVIDSFHDRRTAFEFGVNPAGVKEDRAWSDDGNDDSGWDAVWDVAVSRDRDGWRAEFRIPFSQLRFHPSDDATFGFAVVRQIGRLNETDTWPLISKSANGFVSNFGDLTHLKLSQTPKRLELVPYVVGQVNTQPIEPGNPLVSSRDQKATAGADLKYALRPGVTLTATVNPDFGQVEADPAVVNLSGFETFFSERRPFFLEGAGMFAFNLDCNDGSCSGLFYPRRIGRSPRGVPQLADGQYARVPQQTTILGAAKLTGRAGKFSFGVMNATTADEDAVVANGALRTRELVEPLSNFSVVRARREFANQSSVGFMATGTARRLNSFTSFLPGQAYTGGVDWDLRMRKRYAVQGYWIGSSVHGEAEAIRRIQESTVHSFQRPDADHVEADATRTSLNGQGGSISFSKISGSKVRFTSSTNFKSPGLDINDVGFMRRADTKSMSNWIQFRNDTPSKYLRSFRWNLNQWGTWNHGGDRLDLGGNVNAHWTFTNQWSTGMGFNVNSRNFDDRATRGVGLLQPQPELLGLRQFRRAQVRQRVDLLQHRQRSPRHPLEGDQPGRDDAPDVFPVDQHRHRLEPQRAGRAVGGKRRGRPLRLRPARPDHRVADDAGELHDHAEPVGPGLRGPVCLGRRLRRLQAAGQRPRRALRGPLRADRVRGEPRLQLPVVPDHERPALGVQARIGPVRRLAAGT
jgi:Domain of unknown function (DUF5916)/Carbohydrate family 9 binding domain-like